LKAENKMFMDASSVEECIRSLKVKNLNGMDRIAQRVLNDGVNYFEGPFTGLLL
jgi:hypothetical protein